MSIWLHTEGDFFFLRLHSVTHTVDTLTNYREDERMSTWCNANVSNQSHLSFRLMARRTTEIFDRQMTPVTLKVSYEPIWTPFFNRVQPLPCIGKYPSLVRGTHWQRRHTCLTASSTIGFTVWQRCEQWSCRSTQWTSRSNTLVDFSFYRCEMFMPVEKSLAPFPCTVMVWLSTLVLRSELPSFDIGQCNRDVARRNIRCQNHWTRINVGQSTITHECLESFSSYPRLDGESD